MNLYEKPCPPFKFLDRDALLFLAEKELVKAHPHDSICCCSVDEVNKDVKNRLIEVTQITDEILKDDILKIGASLDGHGHGDTQSDSVEVSVTKAEECGNVIENENLRLHRSLRRLRKKIVQSQH